MILLQDPIKLSKYISYSAHLERNLYPVPYKELIVYLDISRGQEPWRESLAEQGNGCLYSFVSCLPGVGASIGCGALLAQAASVESAKMRTVFFINLPLVAESGALLSLFYDTAAISEAQVIIAAA